MRTAIGLRTSRLMFWGLDHTLRTLSDSVRDLPTVQTLRKRIATGYCCATMLKQEWCRPRAAAEFFQPACSMGSKNSFFIRHNHPPNNESRGRREQEQE